MDNKQKIIKNIEGLYPIDCEYPDTNFIGSQLLIKAINNTKSFSWRDLPIEVLEEYEILCINEENDGELTDELRILKRKGAIEPDSIIFNIKS